MLNDFIHISRGGVHRLTTRHDYETKFKKLGYVIVNDFEDKKPFEKKEGEFCGETHQEIQEQRRKREEWHKEEQQKEKKKSKSDKK